VIVTVRVERKAFATRSGPLHVLGPLEFTIDAGEIVALVGPSGCGKSTLLRLIGGLDPDFEGEIAWADGQMRRIGTVFQEPRLLPWRTVWQNLALVLPPGLEAEAQDLLSTLGLAECHDVYPPALSLGMARRVAIARAFAIAPELVLLDEPFVSLDPAMAERSREVLLAAWRSRPIAALLVTHDLAEAASLADRIMMLSGRPARILRDAAVPAELRRCGIERGAQVAASMRADDPWVATAAAG
jgi:NitT/TauT family transport system ATP-binding protein